MFKAIQQQARKLKSNILALYLAVRDSLVPLYAKLFAGFVVAYALSPIDLIPDFIPVLGYLDDIILLPLGIYIAIKLIPSDIMTECKEKAKAITEKPENKIAGFIIVTVWLLLFLLLLRFIYIELMPFMIL